LAGSAGVAMADVSFSGNAYMGVSNNWSSPVTLDTTWQFISRVRLKMTASGETDGGVTFGASMESHNFADSGQSGLANQNGGSTVYIEGEFGKITMGDVGTASDGIIGNVDKIGLDLPSGGYNELGYLLGNTKTAVKFERSFGDLSFAVSAGQLEQDITANGDRRDEYSIAAKYNFGDYTVALGYDMADIGAGGNIESASQISVAGTATFGNFSAKAIYSVFQIAGLGDEDAWAISGTGNFDAIAVTAYYADHFLGYSAYGIGASYDLGGGAKMKFGYEETDIAGDEAVIDMGLAFDF
ncbi:MAG: porin, partial [Deltaproteobacteria bacterium]